MIHHASPDFWECHRALPPALRQLADQTFERLKSDPRYPSLHFKKVGRFCALAVDASGGLVWFWIGTHAEYDKLVGEPGNGADS